MLHVQQRRSTFFPSKLILFYRNLVTQVLKAWDLKEFTCLQTIPIRFPSTLGGKTPTFGLFPTDLYLNRSSTAFESSFPGGLVLGCSDYLCLMRLGQDASLAGSLTETHTAALSCAVYNPKLRQVRYASIFRVSSSVPFSSRIVGDLCR